MKQQDIATGFQQVDHAQSDFLINLLLRVNAAPSVQECLQEQLRWLDIKEGYAILDVGCGMGNQAFEMAKRVGTLGKVVGTDMSESMIEVSKKQYLTFGLPLTFQMARATEQPFPDASFDRIRTERVLLYVQELDRAFKEFYRLLKPGGRLLAFDVDMDGLIIAHPNKSLTRKIITFISDSFPNGRIGSELLSHFNNANFRDCSVKQFGYMMSCDALKEIYGGILATGIEKGVFTETEVTDWWHSLDQENQKGNHVSSLSGFLVMGTK